MEEQVKRQKYKYDLNSNLVLQGNAPANRGENEPSGEAESLIGRRMAQFGDLAQRERPPDLAQLQQKKQQDKKKAAGKSSADPRKHTNFVRSNFTKVFQNMGGVSDENILNVQIQEELVYRPKTKETRGIYEQILVIVQRHMGDVSTEELKGATDEVLAILKTENMNDMQRKTEIESILDRMSDETFNALTVLAQQLVDYTPEDEYREQREAQYDVNVELDEDDEELEEGEGNEIKPQDDDEEVEEINQIVTEDQEEAQSPIKEQAKQQKDMLDINSIDAHWLKRTLDEHFTDLMAEEILDLETKVMKALRSENPRECEKKLFAIVGVDKFELIRLLVKNRTTIFYGIRLQQAQSQSEKDMITKEMEQTKEGNELLNIILGKTTQEGKRDQILEEADKLTKKYRQPTAADVTEMLHKRVTDEILGSTSKTSKILDFDHIQFQQGARLMANKKCPLPKGSQRITKLGYEEIYVPAVKHRAKDSDKLIPISELPEWARAAFPPPITNLNYIQSKVYQTAFNSNENLLICAPTGAGKTNIALLTIMQILGSKRKTNGRFDIHNFKIIYIAPMKALVTEIVGNFQKRLNDFGLTVRELTGDVHLTKGQIEETQIIVTTPEKWDIITRKSGDRAYLDLVRLIIIDEIHLLHDMRGPVLEAIVARTIRQIEQTQDNVRIVALSATLPNYEDVATFLRVNPDTGLHFFDNSYRPVPLEQIYVGVTEKKAIKRIMLMNEICYEKVMERAGKHQILIFVHSRKETARTAKIIRDMALAKDELHKFIGESSEVREALQQESATALSQDLKDLLVYGIGIHHAGLARKDRQLVEQLFSSGYLQVLVSTATLAWGVNLPAHTVIIKGTQIYSPEQGKWIELSPQDMLQMMGRAGRPQYDTLGEGIIITNHSEIQYHLSLNNVQLPIESQLISQLSDQLNAEIVLGTVSNVKEAVNWLTYSYLYVRMLRKPQLYGVEEFEIKSDPLLVQRRVDLIHTSSLQLSKASMIKYDKRTGTLQSTAIGKIASHYYIKHDSMSIYNDNLKQHMNIIDIFRLFALSREFQYIPVRENEKIELQKFIDKVPIPVKGSLDEPATKINILLQAYISRFKLEGYDLNSDMVYVTQSAGRIIRCLFEIALKWGWAQLSETLLNLCKMIERRQWSSMTPLRQYHGIPMDILRKIEKKEQFTWQHFYEMSAQQIGEIVKHPKMGKLIHRLVHQFPRLEMQAYVQPITRSIIKVEIAITPDFEWEPKIHGKAEPFWVLVEDSDSEKLLHSEQFILKENQAQEQQIITFIVPLHEPMPPQYFIKVISDRWLQSETILPVSFKHLILPQKFNPPTKLEDMHSKLVSDLNFSEAELYFKGEGIKEFNPIQTQIFNKIYQSDESIFVGAPSGSDNIVCAELAIFREIQQETFEKILYITPSLSMCQIKYQHWKKSLGNENLFGLNVVMLTGNLQQDQTLINSGDIIVATPERWDQLQRKWRKRKAIQQIGLYILDELQLLPENDSIYEIVGSRLRYMQSEIERKIRIVALATPIANAKDVANWLGIPFPQNTFNFEPSVRPTPLDIHIQGFDHNNKNIRTQAMQRPAYNVLKKNLHIRNDSQAIVFVTDRRQARLSAYDFITYVSNDENPKRFLNFRSGNLDESSFMNEVTRNVNEQTLIQPLEYGIGQIHDGLTSQEIDYIKNLYKQGYIRVLVVVYSESWSIGDLQAHVTIIIDPERYDGQEKRYVEYSIPDVLQMMGRANLTAQVSRDSPQIAAQCVMYCHTPKKNYFIKFLGEPLPIESHLDHHLHDHLLAEIDSETVNSKADAVDWITWTFMYRRISQNPNYYNLSGNTGQHINDYLSELIETTVDDLQKARCIVVGEDEMEVEVDNIGKIASFYYIKYQTIDRFTRLLSDESNANKRTKYLLEVLSQAAEFEQVPIREGEEVVLKQLARQLTYPIEAANNEDIDYNSAAVKTNILLQCHFNREPLNINLRLDQKFILEQSIKLVHAMVDVISNHEYLKLALLCIELCQMIVQGMWVTQSPLLQLPLLDSDQIDQLKSKGVEDIIDFMNMDEYVRHEILQLDDQQLQTLANVCNRYPNIDIELNTDKKAYTDGEEVQLVVTLRRPNIEDKDELLIYNQPVFAQFYPREKDETLWIIVGDVSTNKLLGIKKVTTFKAVEEKDIPLSFEVNKGPSNKKDLKVYLMNDSYVGCDQEDTLSLTVHPK